MKRRHFLKGLASVPLVAVGRGIPDFAGMFAPARSPFRRVRPSDPDWPSAASWQKLKQQVGGQLSPVEFPLAPCQSAFDSAACQAVVKNIRNPYYVGDQPGLTETLSWVDAWVSKPSAYVVTARNAGDIAAAVNFARENRLRLVVKGGGHSYQGTSNSADSLLIWTRQMDEITLHADFVPQGCKTAPQAAVTLGSGAIWMQAYDVVMTKAGKYVQGGGCTTVGVAGLVQSGGFGSFSKHYGTAAASLLEAEVVTADGKIRIANACTNPDLFWALKGGGGGSFGAVSKVTLRAHDLPATLGGADFQVKANSDAAYRRLVRQFVAFYSEQLFNDRWGEQAHFSGDNTLGIMMVCHGLDSEQTKKTWKPFMDWVQNSPDYSFVAPPIIGAIPAQGWWDPAWRAEHHQAVFKSDDRPNAPATNVWWNGDGGQVSWTIYAYESQWLPASLLKQDAQERLADALFAGSRIWDIELHFNKGLAGAPADALAASRETATNPAVLDAFALAIIGSGSGPSYPGVQGHEPNVERARKDAAAVGRAMAELRNVSPVPGAYVSESNFFEKDWQHSFWGSNYERLQKVKAKYDPDGLFFVHHGVGSENWSDDGFTRVKKLA
jgi:FAD/FMN-containing dehydrogenase